MDWCLTLQELASLSPTGLLDPHASEKLIHEQEELVEKLMEGDLLGAILEAADVLYYAAKCSYLGVFDYEMACRIAFGAAISVGIDFQLVFAVSEAKYAWRLSNNSKCDATERNLARKVLGM